MTCGSRIGFARGVKMGKPRAVSWQQLLEAVAFPEFF